MKCTPKVRQTYEDTFLMGRTKKYNSKYSPEFKANVIIDMRENKISYSDTIRKYFPEFLTKSYRFNNALQLCVIYLQLTCHLYSNTIEIFVLLQ